MDRAVVAADGDLDTAVAALHERHHPAPHVPAANGGAQRPACAIFNDAFSVFSLSHPHGSYVTRPVHNLFLAVRPGTFCNMVSERAMRCRRRIPRLWQRGHLLAFLHGQLASRRR